MPRKRSVKKSTVKSLTESESSKSIRESVKTPLNLNSMVTSPSKRFTREGLQEIMEESLRAVEEKGQRAIQEIEAMDKALRLSLTAKQMQTPIALDNISDLMAILNHNIFNLYSEETLKLLTPAAVRHKRRSRSICREQLSTIHEKCRPGRSSSAGPGINSTPQQSHPIAEQLLMANKYTVRKPFERMNNPVKRAMRVGEEAISTSGSPLFVQSRVPSEPEVHIPLENGMIFNIDPTNASKKIVVPELDERTKAKIRVLCGKLQECISK